MEYAVLTAVGLGIGFLIGFLIQKTKLTAISSTLQAKIDLLNEGKKEDEIKFQERMEQQKKENTLELKSLQVELEKEVDREVKKKNKNKERQFSQLESKLNKREETLENRTRNLDSRDKNLARKELNLEKHEKDVELSRRELERNESQVELKLQEAIQKLEFISGLTRDAAKEYLMKQLEDEAKHESLRKIQRIVGEAEEDAEKQAKTIISQAIQRYAGEYVSERTVSVVHLNSDDIKGRIIGREGRNIRAFEAATGVDLIIDETPEAVVLSSFHPVRREVAKIALERLIGDGRIHPARIEEIVKKVQYEVNEKIVVSGKEALMELNIPPNMNQELIKLIGTLKYRYSYGQNMWQHAIEVGFMSGLLAEELGIDVKIARRAGLLHDIGKAVDHEIEGSHAVIGANLAKRYGERQDIVHAIEAHHNDVPPETILAFIVDAADALSGARPGARRETMETFVKRLQDIENICQSFNGIQKSFAIQAGREVRVIVEQDQVTDAAAAILSRDLAKKIEENVTYPGQIKIVVIREKRVISYAS